MIEEEDNKNNKIYPIESSISGFTSDIYRRQSATMSDQKQQELTKFTKSLELESLYELMKKEGLTTRAAYEARIRINKQLSMDSISRKREIKTIGVRPALLRFAVVRKSIQTQVAPPIIKKAVYEKEIGTYSRGCRPFARSYIRFCLWRRGG